MSLHKASRSIGGAVLVAAAMLLGACGGGGSGSAASSATSNQLKLSTAVQSEPVARYAAAFGILSGPGVAAIYTSVVQSLVTSVAAGTAATTTLCPASGSIVVAGQNTGSSGLQGGEIATVNFNQCVGQVSAPGVSSSATVSGSVTVQVQSAQGVVGNHAANWSYTAVETANNLTLISSTGTTVLNGTATFTMSYDAATGVTTTTASSPSVTLNVTEAVASGNVNGTITITSLNYSRIHDSDPSGDTVSASGGISVQASDAVIAFNITTPTPVTISNGVVQGGVIQLSGDNAVESITPVSNSTVNISVTANGQTGTYSENLGSLRQLTGS